MKITQKDLTLDEIDQNEWLSARTLHVCQKYGLTHLSLIILYYKENGDFLKLDKAGKQTSNELIAICKKYSNYFELENTVKQIDDLTLNQLHQIESLSARTLDTCQKYGLTHLSFIILYYKEHGDFLKLPYAGKQTSNELLTICNKYMDQFVFEDKIKKNKDLTLDQLDQIEWLSTRTLHICQKYGLTHLSLIILYYKENGNFLKLEKAGKQTSNELITICKKYIDQFIFEETTKKDVVEELLESIDPKSFLTFTEFFTKSYKLLPDQLSEHVEQFIDSGNPISGFVRFFSTNYKKLHIKGVGPKKINQLIEFQNKFRVYLFNLKTITDATSNNEEDNTDDENAITFNKMDAAKEYLKSILLHYYHIKDHDSLPKFDGIITNDLKFNLFKLIEILIDLKIIYNSNSELLFKKIYGGKGSLFFPYPPIAKFTKLSNERVRQLKIKIIENTHQDFGFIKEINSSFYQDYYQLTALDFFILNEDFTEKMNIKEQVNFNKHFYATIFGILNNDFTSFGIFNSISQTKPKLNFKNYYLIKHAIYNDFDFAGFTNNLCEIKNQSITQENKIKLENLIVDYLLDKNSSLISEITQICERIIINEFELHVNTLGEIILEANKRRPLLDYIVEVLEENGSLMKVDKILLEVNEKNPGLNTTDISVRLYLQRHKDVFISIGRSSTYGLKKWETEKQNIKGGTIRKLVKDLLEAEKRPLHISEILDHVKQFRDTNEISIVTNLELEENRLFRFFYGGFIGLNSIKYKPGTTNFKSFNGNYFRYALFNKFHGKSIDLFINKYSAKYGYLPIQLKHYLNKKVDAGEIEIVDGDMIRVLTNKK